MAGVSRAHASCAEVLSLYNPWNPAAPSDCHVLEQAMSTACPLLADEIWPTSHAYGCTPTQLGKAAALPHLCCLETLP